MSFIEQFRKIVIGKSLVVAIDFLLCLLKERKFFLSINAMSTLIPFYQDLRQVKMQNLEIIVIEIMYRRKRKNLLIIISL